MASVGLRESFLGVMRNERAAMWEAQATGLPWPWLADMSPVPHSIRKRSTLC